MRLFRRRQSYTVLPIDQHIIVESGMKLGPLQVVHFFTCPICFGRIEMDSEDLMEAALAAAAGKKPFKSLTQIMYEHLLNVIKTIDGKGEFLTAREDPESGTAVIEGESFSIRYAIEDNLWSLGPGRPAETAEEVTQDQ